MSASTQSANELARPRFSAHSTAKTNDKSTNLRNNGIYRYICCCDHFSIIGENPSEEVDEDYYYYYE